MMEAIGCITFPVVFSDGESESEIGDVVVYPTMDFKRFQTVLSQKIGISPNQFSVFISSPESRLRIPVTSKVNFGVISPESNCFFLVVLRRTKRGRRGTRGRRSHQFQSNDDDYYNNTTSYCSPKKINNPLENAVFLRRGMGISYGGEEASSGLGFPFSGRVEWEKRVRELQIEKERYLMNMGFMSADGFGLGQGGDGGGGGGGLVCEECSRAEEMGTEVGFHWCAYDPVVTFRFRSPAGPISRPTTR